MLPWQMVIHATIYWTMSHYRTTLNTPRHQKVVRLASGAACLTLAADASHFNLSMVVKNAGIALRISQPHATMPPELSVRSLSRALLPCMRGSAGQMQGQIDRGLSRGANSSH